MVVGDPCGGYSTCASTRRRKLVRDNFALAGSVTRRVYTIFCGKPARSRTGLEHYFPDLLPPSCTSFFDAAARRLLKSPDKFFKAALTQPDAARSFLRDYLPAAVAETLDLSRLQLIKDSFVDETLQEQFSDLLYEVGLRDGGQAYVCVLFEHKRYLLNILGCDRN